MAERADAIVLRVSPVTESSLIVTWFAREAGKLKTMAKGARRPKSPWRGRIDLFYRDEIVFLRSKRTDLHLLQDCFLENARARLRDSVPALTAASYATELVELITEPEDPNAMIFDLLAETLDRLENSLSAVLLLWFELGLLAAAGWRPKWEAGNATGKLLQTLSGAPAAGAERVELTERQVAEARQQLWRFWDREVGRAPRTRTFLAGQIR